jgi:hypothetical protein
MSSDPRAGAAAETKLRTVGECLAAYVATRTDVFAGLEPAAVAFVGLLQARDAFGREIRRLGEAFRADVAAAPEIRSLNPLLLLRDSAPLLLSLAVVKPCVQDSRLLIAEGAPIPTWRDPMRSRTARSLRLKPPCLRPWLAERYSFWDPAIATAGVGLESNPFRRPRQCRAIRRTPRSNVRPWPFVQLSGGQNI